MTNNVQLSIFLNGYARQLGDAIELMELPEAAGETRTITPLIGKPYDEVFYPCLEPLLELLQRIREDVELLRCG